LDQGLGPPRRQGEGRGHGADARTLTAKEIIVATGSQPRSVPGIELDKKHVITSDEAIHLAEIPKSLAIMGSGAVGVEFASIFKRSAAKCTVIELLPRLVPNEDAAIPRSWRSPSRRRASPCGPATKVTSASP
jgi:dihydrolipoamide dehydrogenase